MAYQDRNRDFPSRQMYDAVCSECGQKCQVPFEPKEDRPVFCRDCYQKKRQERNR